MAQWPRARLAHRRAGASLVVALALTACSAGSDAESADQESTTATSTPPAKTRPSPSETNTDDAATCRSRQKRAIAALEWPVLQEVWRVMASPTQGSAQAARRVRSRVDLLETKVDASCTGGATEIGPFVDAVHAATESGLDEQGASRIVAAYSAWAAAVHARDNLKGLKEDLVFCDQFEDAVRAGYEVLSEPATYGKRTWVQMVVENDTSTRYWVDLGGQLWATELRPDLARGHPRDPDRGGHQWVWGGSSADSMDALPYARSTKDVGVGESQYLYMKPDGQVYGIRPEVTVTVGGHTCSLPVSRIN